MPNGAIRLALLVILGVAAHDASASLRTSRLFAGSIDAELAAIGTTGIPNSFGTIIVRTMPPGAVTLFAALYATDFIGTSESPGATFDGRVLGTTTAFDVDPNGHLVYRWIVTPLVTGSRNYDAIAGPFFACPGLALVVVFTHPSLPNRTVVYNEGATSFGGARVAETTFDGVGPGFGEAWIYLTGTDWSLSDDVRMNGDIVSDLAFSNLRGESTVAWAAGRTRSGTNSLEILPYQTSKEWYLAVLIGPPECAAGNVNARAGPVFDVLTVNESPGGPSRTVELGPRDPIAVSVAAPPSLPQGPAPFALYAWSGPPDGIGDLPNGIGSACMRMPLAGGDPRLRAIWNNLGRPSLLGFATFPSSPAPSLVFTDPNGLGRPATFFVQGLIADPESPSRRVAVTNGVTVVVR